MSPSNELRTTAFFEITISGTGIESFLCIRNVVQAQASYYTLINSLSANHMHLCANAPFTGV